MSEPTICTFFAKSENCQSGQLPKQKTAPKGAEKTKNRGIFGVGFLSAKEIFPRKHS
jgi:hypothetical protein